MADKKEQSELKKVWSVISHDLSTPLLVIQGNLKHLSEKLIPFLLEVYQKAKDAGLDIPIIPQGQLEAYQKALPNMKTAVDRLRQLVSRWSHKISFEKFHPTKQPVNIVACVRASIETYRTTYELADKSRIHINLNDATIFGDEQMIQYILYELFSNAEDASDTTNDKQNDIIVSLSSTVDSKNYNLHVKNIGSSISDSDLPKLFCPYFSTKSSHMGLGLTFCQWAMNSMEGDITCHPKNDGVEFVLTFPLTKS